MWGEITGGRTAVTNPEPETKEVKHHTRHREKQ